MGLSRRFLSYFCKNKPSVVSATSTASGSGGSTANTPSAAGKTATTAVSAVSAEGPGVAAPGVLPDAESDVTETNAAVNLVKLGFWQFDDEFHEVSPLRRRTLPAADLDGRFGPGRQPSSA